jgi:hypothetical protein
MHKLHKHDISFADPAQCKSVAGIRWPDPEAGQGGRGHWSKGRWQGSGERRGALSSICAALHSEPRLIVASASAASAVAQTKAGRTHITQTAAACEGRLNGQSAGIACWEKRTLWSGVQEAYCNELVLHASSDP